MTPGRKLKTPAEKALAGTITAHRDAHTGPIVQVTSDAPIPPMWLTPEARKVWDAELPRLMATGATVTDSAMVALYCTTLSDFIAGVASGEAPNAAFRSELRKQMELLGVAGARSRLAKLASPATSPANPFLSRQR